MKSSPVPVLAEPPRLPAKLSLNERVLRLHEEVRSFPPHLCAERALLVTRHFREQRADKPMVLQKAGALAYILRRKRVRIHSEELLVGCFTSHRVGGQLFPELHGIPVLEDLLRFDRRRVNPFVVSAAARARLLAEVAPFWTPRFLAVRSVPPSRALAFAAEQISPKFYLINESGGVSHFVPDYRGLVTRGIDGYRREATDRLRRVDPSSPEAAFLRAVQVACDGLELFADGYRREALRQESKERDPKRRRELREIAKVCGRVPRHPASTLHEALQSILFAQIALNIESLDNAVSPGRLDQILWPYYLADLAAGRLDQAGAFELLGCFAVKLCEIVPFFSHRMTRFHGGLMNGQVVVVGGTDRRGRDSTNELTHLFLELMDRLRTRQPNYHARFHRGGPGSYRAHVARVLAAGAVSPAVYNDEVIVPVLQWRGLPEEDARDYATVGCVEPVAAGKSFLSTDAALFNLPLCLELAFNQGRRFGQTRRIGPATPPAEECKSAEDLASLFAVQLRDAVERLLRDIRYIEEGNARFHPTPLTSMLLEGCLESMRDATSGGARYNGSGIQGVGAVEVGEGLAAVDHVVFRQGRATLAQVVEACRTDFRDAEPLRARLRGAPKFGNDDPAADGWVARTIEMFTASLRGRKNFRGGDYAAGFYSMTSHQAFGEVVGGLPSGRRAGEPFSSGLSATSGMDRLGPTALLQSVARLPLHLARNGVNVNLQLAPWAVAGPEGARRLQDLVDGGFRAGCMQLQVNVLDPKVLVEARDNPGRFPGLLVRVSGYSAYFDDLSPEMKQEVIDRTLHEAAHG